MSASVIYPNQRSQVRYSVWQPWEINALATCTAGIKTGDQGIYSQGWQLLTQLQQLRALGGLVRACGDLVRQCFELGALVQDDADISVHTVEQMVAQAPPGMGPSPEALMDMIALVADVSSPEFWSPVLLDPLRYLALLLGTYTCIASWLAGKAGMSLDSFVHQHLAAMQAPELVHENIDI